MEDLNEKLWIAARDGNTDEVVSCLQRGADINYKDSDGVTALHKAAANGRDRIVEILVEGGGDMNVQDEEGRTALHRAAWGGHDRIVEILVEGGGDVNVQDKWSSTALHLAAWWGHDRIVEVLVEGGGDVNVQNDKGSTPLHNAVKERKTKTAAILIQAGCDKSILDNEGKNPLDYASGQLKEELEKLASQIEEVKAAFPSIAGTKEFRNLLMRGTYSSHNNRVYLAGACNVGKSTLASNLIGEHIMLEWNSTDGLVIYFGRNGIDLEKKEMIPLPKDSEDSSILSNVLRGQPSMDQFPKNVDDDNIQENPNLHESVKRMAIVSDTTHSGHTNTSSKGILSSISRPVEDSTHMNVTGQERSRGTLSREHHSLASKQRNTYIRRHIMDEIRKGEYQVRIAPSDLVDFGGQKAFDLTHQLFIQQKGAFVLLLDGRKDLDEFLPEYEDVKMTTRDIMLHWVSSILIYCAREEEDIYPLIIFAATHRDELTKEEEQKKSEVLTRQLTDMFIEHEHGKRIRYQEIFFINSIDRDDSGVVKLKRYLVDVAFEQKSWGEKMPMAWVPLELQLAEMRLNEKFILSYDELCAINENNADLSLTDKQLNQFLRCQHSLGRVMYFEQHGLNHFVIVQPTAMVDILRSFVTDKIFWPKDLSLHCILSTACEKGIMKKCDLLKLWSQDEFNRYVPNTEIKDFITQVLVHLDILVEPKRFHTSKESLTEEFIIPCLIKRSLPPELFPYNLDHNKTIILSYRLLKTTIPNALAYKLIGAVLNIWPLKTKNGLWYLFDKAAVLEIDQTNKLYISLRENQLIVGLFNNRLKNYISPEIASIIQECLTLTITNVLEFYFTSFGKSASCTDISKLFDIEFGEKCGEEMCFISISDVHKKSCWNCKNNKEHRFPLYWVFDQTQEMCSIDCSGLDTVVMNEVPDDKHLIRLAKHIGQEFDNFVIYLGLSKIEWDEIKEDSAIGKMLTRKFFGLCEWKMKKNAKNVSPTFTDLAKSLAYIDYDEHFLCLIFRERFTEVFAMDNPRLQETPDDSVLQELSRNIGNQTLHLGVELEIDRTSIEETQFRFPKDMYAQTYDILIKWKTTSKVKPTVRALMLALQYVDSRGFLFLQKQYGLEERSE